MLLAFHVLSISSLIVLVCGVIAPGLSGSAEVEGDGRSWAWTAKQTIVKLAASAAVVRELGRSCISGFSAVRLRRVVAIIGRGRRGCQSARARTVCAHEAHSP